MQIKALQAIIADLHERPGAEQALDHARALLAFYRQEAQRADYLTGDQEPDLVPRPALRRGVRERQLPEEGVLAGSSSSPSCGKRMGR